MLLVLHTGGSQVTEPLLLTDSTLEQHAGGDKPLVLLLTTGDGLRGDFSSVFKGAVDQYPDVTFARLNPAINPQAAARFGTSDKPLLIGMIGGEEVVRRFRPWGSDMPLLVEELRTKAAARSARTDPEAVAVSERPTMPVAPVKPVPSQTESAMSNLPYDTAPVKVTDATFQAEVIDHPLPVLVDFWAEWCGPCRQIGPALERLAKEFAGQIRIAKVNVDENPGLSQSFRVMSIPNLMMIKNRTMVFNQPGALPEPVMRDLIKQLIALEIPAHEDEQDQEEQPAQ